jgi:hemoglobin/transferrin/lactoferrin receptor protein
MSRTKLACLAAASTAALLAAFPVLAADSAPGVENEVDKVTVTATRSEKAVEDAPVTVSVISSTEIEDRLVKDIKDLIRFEPGVSVRSAPARFTAAGASTGRDGNAGFNIRGLEGNRVLLVVDGVRVPDGFAFGAQSAGRGDYVDLDILKSVEIVRGPSSAMYGSDGLAGAVSFITKDPSDIIAKDKRFAGRARVSYASADESWSESLVAAGKTGNWEALFAYTRRDGEGQETAGTNTSANTDRTTANPEDNTSNAGLAKLVYTPNDHHHFRLTLDHLDRQIDWTVLSALAKPPLASTSVLGLTAFDKMRRDRLSFDHRYTGGEGLIRSAQTTVYYQESHTKQFSAEDRNTAVDRTRDATFDNEVFGAALELHSQAEFGGVEHAIVWGGDASRTRQEGIRDGAVPPAGETFPARAFPTTDYSLAGAFVQDEFAVGPVTFFPAVRYDYYKLQPKADALFTANVPSGQSDSKVTGFTGGYDDFIEQVQIGGNFTTANPAVYQFVNLSGVKISGAEAAASLELAAGFTARTAISYARGASETNGVNTPLTSIDPVKVVGGLDYRAPSGLFGGQLSAVHSERKSLGRSGLTCSATGVATTSPYYCFSPPSFTVVDVTGWWNVTEAVTLRAAVFNLTDKTYWWWSDARGLAANSTVTEGYSQPGRNYSVSLAVKF